MLYVAATRGRESNRIYVDTHYDPDPQTGHEGVTWPQTAREVLAGVLQREGADLGAHDTIRMSHEAADGMVQLHAEYTTLAKASQAERWDSLLERSGLSARELAEVRDSNAYGPLVATLRDAESRGLDVETTLPHLVAARSLADAQDVASVLHGRVDRWVEAAGSKRMPAADLIVGLVPRAKGVADEDMARALRERDEAMERRATTLAELAVERNVAWVRCLGAPPADPATRAAWIREVRVVAAYRDRWGTGGKAVVDRPRRRENHRAAGPPKACTGRSSVGAGDHSASPMSGRTAVARTFPRSLPRRRWCYEQREEAKAGSRPLGSVHAGLGDQQGQGPGA